MRNDLTLSRSNCHALQVMLLRTPGATWEACNLPVLKFTETDILRYNFREYRLVSCVPSARATAIGAATSGDSPVGGCGLMSYREAVG